MNLKEFVQLFVCFGLGLGAEATDYTFNNSSGGNWSSSSNWTPTGVPGAADRATIASGTYTVTLDVDATVTALIVGGGTNRPTLNISVRTLTINSTGTMAPGGTLSLSGGTLTGAADVAVTGALNWTGGRGNGVRSIQLILLKNDSATFWTPEG